MKTHLLRCLHNFLPRSILHSLYEPWRDLNASMLQFTLSFISAKKKTLNVCFFSISLLPHLCGRLIWSQLDNLGTDVLQYTKVQSMLPLQREHVTPKTRESLRHFWSDFRTHLGHQGQLESSSDAVGVFLKLVNVSRLCGWVWRN